MYSSPKFDRPFRKIIAAGTFLGISLTCAATNSVFLKTGPEVFASYASIMSISDKDPDLLDLYHQDKERLPQRGLPAEMTNNVVLAMTELGGAFCQKAIAREQGLTSAQRYMFNEVDFTQGVTQFNDDYNTGKMLERLALVFWTRDIQDGEKQALSKAISAASAGATDTVDQTLNITQLVCTLYATSLSFLIK